MSNPVTTATASQLSRPTRGQRLRWLVLVHGPDWREGMARSWLLKSGDVVVGREPDRGGLCIDEGSVSRRHAELHHEPGLDAVQVRDLGSKNGSWVNGRRVDTEHLACGSVLRLGDAILVELKLFGIPVRCRNYGFATPQGKG